MKRNGNLMKTISLFTALLFVSGLVVSCGGGGGGSTSLSPITYSDPNQAASASSDAAGTVALVEAMTAAASGMVDSSSGQAGYASNKRKSPNTAAIADIDPRLKTIVEKMVVQMQTTGATNARIKTKMSTMKTVDLSSTCDPSNSGDYSVSGSDNSDTDERLYDEASVTITFNNCRNSVDWTEMNGTIELYSKITPSAPATATSAIGNVTANNLTFKQYYPGSFDSIQETGVINAVFKSTDNISSRSDHANGSFDFHDYSSGENGKFFFKNLTSNWSTLTESTATTDTQSMNGSFAFSYSDGYNSIGLTLSLADLEYKKRTYSDDPSVDAWLNGSIGIVWDPLVCASGLITFTTVTPLHYADIYEPCPNSGTLKVNNATIEYGSPIYVTVNGFKIPYTDCYAMDNAGNGMCL